MMVPFLAAVRILHCCRALVLLVAVAAVCRGDSNQVPLQLSVLTPAPVITSTLEKMAAVRLMVRKLPTPATPLKALLKEFKGRHVLLLVGDTDEEQRSAQDLLSAAWRAGKDARLAPCSMHNTSLQATLLPSGVKQWQRLLVVLLCPITEATRLMTQVSEQSLMNPWVTWLTGVRDSDALCTLGAQVKDGSELLTAVVRDGQPAQLFKSKTNKDETVSLKRVGRWQPSPAGEGLVLREPLYPSSDLLRRLNMGGRHLRVAVVDNWPFFGLQETDGGYSPDSGIDVSVLTTLSLAMNFTFSVVSPSDGQWGGPTGDGNITGMIGMVARDEAQLAIDEITITGAREAVVDFSRPYYMESSTVLSRAPAPASKALAVFSPFTALVWGLLMSAVVMIGPILTFLARLQKTHRTRLGVGVPGKEFSPFDYSYNAFRTILYQDNRAKPKTVTLRFLFGFWYIFGYIVYALYAGTLTAVLAAPTYERTIDGLEDLLAAARKEGFIPVVTSGSSIHELFASAKSGLYHDIYREFSGSNSLAASPDEGVKRVRTLKAALVEATLATEIRAALQGSQLFHLGRQSFYPQAYGIACRQGAPYRMAIDALLSRMLEAGLISKWKSDEVKKVSAKKQSGTSGGSGDQGKAGVLTLTHLQGAFFLYLLGTCASCLVLLVEFFVGRYRSCRPNNKELHNRQEGATDDTHE